MPTFKTITLRNENGREYQIDLSLNDAAIMNDNLEIEVSGRHRWSSDEEWVEVVFSVSLDVSEGTIQLVFREEVVGILDINPAVEQLREAIDELAAQEAWQEVQKLFRESQGGAIEQAIQRIPAVDPVFGCLIKAGLSTAIGQVIECHSKVQPFQFPRIRQRVLAMLRCLGVNSLPMVAKFTYRTFTCAALGGWDVI